MPISDCSIQMIDPDVPEQMNPPPPLVLIHGVSTSDVTLLTFSHALSPSASSQLCNRRSSSVQQGQQKRCVYSILTLSLLAVWLLQQLDLCHRVFDSVAVKCATAATWARLLASWAWRRATRDSRPCHF